jgi:hypothetical protein
VKRSFLGSVGDSKVGGSKIAGGEEWLFVSDFRGWAMMDVRGRSSMVNCGLGVWLKQGGRGDKDKYIVYATLDLDHTSGA